jgi:hypothetical protein
LPWKIERASSHNSSVVFEKDMDKLLNETPLSHRSKENTNHHHHAVPIQSPPPGLDLSMDIFKDDTTTNTPKRHAKSKSQPKVAASSSSKSASWICVSSTRKH